MMFARVVHREQRRKYTNNPYSDHLAEVAGIAATGHYFFVTLDTVIAVSWLHDCVEDHGIAYEQLVDKFGSEVASGVMMLSDLETGTRVERKLASRDRLSRAPGWIQTIKCADIISNTSSIVQHDPDFSVTYLEEKRLMLDVLSDADPMLRQIAREQCETSQISNNIQQKFHAYYPKN